MEKPVECSQCKKKASIVYKEMIGEQIQCYEMCAECPILEQSLHGEAQIHCEIGLCCGTCHTTLEAIKMGEPLGCSECYSVFSSSLLQELIASDKVKKQALHIGKTPKHSLDIPSSNRLSSLSDALKEALKKENYESAAKLRDQIKAIEEKGNEA